jgi:iron complex outermembrane recepter protein
MKTLPLRARRAALPLAILAGTVPSLHAQSTDARTLSTTVVSATRFQEDLQSLPAGVSVITADEIRRSAAPVPRPSTRSS